MSQRRATVLTFVTTLVLSLSPLAFAEEATSTAPPSAAQIEQLQTQLAEMQKEMPKKMIQWGMFPRLQTQLAEMQKEMGEMRKVLAGSGDIPAEKRQMMEQHLGMMQQHWQQMHDHCCMMNLVNCPGMGAASRK